VLAAGGAVMCNGAAEYEKSIVRSIDGELAASAGAALAVAPPDRVASANVASPLISRTRCRELIQTVVVACPLGDVTE
jgi:hypothetical protein